MINMDDLSLGIACITVAVMALISALWVLSILWKSVVGARRTGLRPEHHTELNRMHVKQARYDELRREYEGNQGAQRQIDRYDPRSRYAEQREALVNAYREHDEEQAGKILSWFAKNHPGE